MSFFIHDLETIFLQRNDDLDYIRKKEKKRISITGK